MNTYYKLRIFFVLISSVFITIRTTYAQSKPATHLSSRIEVKKEISSNNFTLIFKNKIGTNQADFKRFENKVNQAGFPGLINVTIDPETNKMIAVFEPNTTEKELQIFFPSIGYNDFVIIQ